MMKGLIIFMMLCATLGTSCTCSRQVKSRGQEQPIMLASPLIQDKYELFSVIGGGKPIAENIYLLAKAGNTQLEIRNTKDFAQIVKDIASKDDALALVRLLTSQELRPFLRDVYYAEVHQKVEPKKQGEAEDRWFAIARQQYETWKLYEPLVTEAKGQYKIERFVACYPQIKEKETIPAKLVKIWEWVDEKGTYSAEIKEVIAEGDTIHQILLFTK
jgi:hypothetical protein